MLNLSKYRVQKVELLKKNQTDLYETVRHLFPKATDEEFGKIAGLIMEYVIQSGGNPEIFVTDGDLEFLEEEDEEDEF